jgi:hypothetical protein
MPSTSRSKAASSTSRTSSRWTCTSCTRSPRPRASRITSASRSRT